LFNFYHLNYIRPHGHCLPSQETKRGNPLIIGWGRGPMMAYYGPSHTNLEKN
jgi:hypothetical protein